MKNSEVAELYKIIPIGTEVTIVDGPYGPFGKGFRNLKSGMYGSDVLEIQRKLKELGFFNGLPNGKFGEETEKAVQKYCKENGIAYISVRNYHGKFDDELRKFVATGAKVKNANVIILDVRGHSGGIASYIEKWCDDFAGSHSNVKIRADRNAPSINSSSSTGDQTTIIVNKIKRITNDTPIILLTDDSIASAGELKGLVKI